MHCIKTVNNANNFIEITGSIRRKSNVPPCESLRLLSVQQFFHLFWKCQPYLLRNQSLSLSLSGMDGINPASSSGHHDFAYG